MPPKPPAKFSANERVLCYHGAMLYEAKILDVGEVDGVMKYYIHYKNWNTRWDEWVADDRLLELTDENLKKAADLSVKHGSTPGGKSGANQRSKTPADQSPAPPAVKTKTPATSGRSKTGTGASSSGPPTPFDGSSVKDGIGGGLELESRASTPSVDGGASIGSTSTTSHLGNSQSRGTKRKAATKPKSGVVGSSSIMETPRSTGTEITMESATEPKRKRGRQLPTLTPTSNNSTPAPGLTAAQAAATMNPAVGVESYKEYRDRQEIKVTLPDELCQVLTDDWDMIMRQNKLYKLPASISVDRILDDYIRVKERTKNASGLKFSKAKETANGLREYFNEMCGPNLFYAVERPQYNEVLAEKRGQQNEQDASPSGSENGESSTKNLVRVSAIYGFPHLLRLFVRIGRTLAQSDLEAKTIDSIVGWIGDMMKYLVKNRNALFKLEDYETATPEYQRKAFAN